jgi:adenylate kinase family enzyme
MKVIIFLGLPGSGKSVLGKQVASNNEMDYISTGDLSREYQIKENYVNTGALDEKAEDYIRFSIVDAVSKALNTKKSIILDGFPRSIEQFKFLKEHFPKIDYSFIHLKISPKTAESRIWSRRRSDDGSQNDITNRVNRYVDITNTVVEYLKTSGELVIEVSAESSINSLVNRIESLLKLIR